MHKKSAYKTPIHKTENHIKVDNIYGFIEFDATMAKKSRKNIVDTRSNEKLNGSNAKISQLIH